MLREFFKKLKYTAKKRVKRLMRQKKQIKHEKTTKNHVFCSFWCILHKVVMILNDKKYQNKVFSCLI